MTRDGWSHYDPAVPTPLPTREQWLGAALALVAMACVYAVALAWMG